MQVRPLKKAKTLVRSAYFHVTRPGLFDDRRHAEAFEMLRTTVAGRSVALIGNAQSLFARNDGAEIDSADLVMRLNRGFIRDNDKQGKRTDIFCLSTRMGWVDVKAAFGEQALIVYGNKDRWVMSREMWRKRNEIAYYPIAWWRELSGRIGGRVPSTGLMSVDMLRRLGAREIRLYGFDWKRTRTFYQDQLLFAVHDWEAERQLVVGWADEGGIVLPPDPPGEPEVADGRGG